MVEGWVGGDDAYWWRRKFIHCYWSTKTFPSEQQHQRCRQEPREPTNSVASCFRSPLNSSLLAAAGVRRSPNSQFTHSQRYSLYIAPCPSSIDSSLVYNIKSFLVVGVRATSLLYARVPSQLIKVCGNSLSSVSRG